MNVIVIYTIFLSLLCALLIISTYFVSSIVSRHSHQRRLSKRIAEIRPLFWQQMQIADPLAIPASEIDRLRRISLNRIGLEAFTQCYRDYVAEKGYSDKVQIYVGRVVDYKILLKNRIVRNQYRTSYILYLLAEYRVHNEEVDRLALRSLDNRSLYTRNNAMMVIKNTGNVALVIEALRIIGQSRHYFNNKMIIDFFDTFVGDQEALTRALLENFDHFSLFIKRLLPGHFMNQRADDEEVRALMLRCLNEEDKELIIGASKYFGWVTEPAAKDIILRNIDHQDWEVRAQSARVSQRGYASGAMVDALERRLSDNNWYVRMNSAYSFIAMVEDEERIQAVIDGADRYAREITLYVMFEKKMIDYEQFAAMTGAAPSSETGAV